MFFSVDAVKYTKHPYCYKQKAYKLSNMQSADTVNIVQSYRFDKISSRRIKYQIAKCNHAAIVLKAYSDKEKQD